MVRVLGPSNILIYYISITSVTRLSMGANWYRFDASLQEARRIDTMAIWKIIVNVFLMPHALMINMELQASQLLCSRVVMLWDV